MLVNGKKIHCVSNFSSGIEGYWLYMKKDKWFDKIKLTDSSFEKWAPGEPGNKDCTIGEWTPGGSSDPHMWRDADCNQNNKYLKLCQNIVGM